MIYFPLHLAALIYVLTGGPSVGKTSIIQELEKQGEATVREAATDWIASRIAAGCPEFWKEDNLQYNILSLQLARERPFLKQDGRVFVDRGIFDSFAYIPLFSLAGSKELSLMNQAIKPFDLNQHYAAIFLILPYNEADFTPSQNEIRRENSHEFDRIHSGLYAIYCRHRHFIVVPGNMTPEERALFIREHINRIEASSKESSLL